MTAEDSPPRSPAGTATGVGSLRGRAQNVITGTNGSVWAIGTQYNVSVAPPRPRRGPLELDAEQEHLLRRVFVTPPGWGEALSALVEHRVVLLRGEPNSGRRAAAWRLLVEVPGDDDRVAEELSPASGDPDGGALDPSEVSAGGRYLLDLSTVDADMFTRAEQELPGFLRTVRKTIASLVVVLPSDDGRLVSPELSQRAIRLGRPDNETVFRRHTDYYEITVPGQLLPDLEDDLRASGPRQAARLAFYVRLAREESIPGQGLPEWLGVARDATFGRQREVADLVDAHPGFRPRALMFAAALFEGEHDEVVSEAERQLLAVVEHSAEDVPVFEQSDLRARLEQIGGRLRPDGRIEFRNWNQAAAVRAHFWSHFPALRDRFREWAIACGGLMASPGVDIENLVSRFVDDCLGVRRHRDVRQAVEKWAGNPDLAGLTLAYGLSRPAHGWYFRRACYDWATAKSGSVPGPLAIVVAGACRDVIARNHPAQAIVRLRHLAAHTDGRVSDVARAGLATVVGDDPERLRYFLRRPSDGREDPRRRADAQCFVAVIENWLRHGRASTLVTRSDIRAKVVERWRDVLDALEAPHQWLAVQTWLTAARGEPVCGPSLVAVLIDATECRASRVRALEEAACEWAGTADDAAARRLVDLLVTALDTAVVDAVLGTETQHSPPVPDSHNPEGEQS